MPGITEQHLSEYKRIYRDTAGPVEVNFRELVPELNVRERYTHFIHSYPAKLLAHIPYYFLQSDLICPFTGKVLDPFCGTGTVALESILSGRDCYNADANPLARLIAQVKTTYIPEEVLLKNLEWVIAKAKHYSENENSKDELVDRWFSVSTLRQLDAIESAIGSLKDDIVKKFFQVSFSSVVKKVSFADPTISVPVKLNPERFQGERKSATEFRLKTLQDVDVFEVFESTSKLNIVRVGKLKDIRSCSDIISADARTLTAKLDSFEMLADSSVDLVLTSPPYAGAQKYIRSSWLNLFWLGTKESEEIRKLNSKNIGREDYHKSDIYKVETGIEAADKVIAELYDSGKKERSFIVGNYLLEMQCALIESIRVLRPGGKMVIVIGNNTVCGRPFDTQEYITTYLESKGLKTMFKLIDDIKSCGLMTKRNKTASRITREWVLVFEK